MPKVEPGGVIQGVLAVRDPWTWARNTLFEEPDQHGEPNPERTEIVDKVGSLVYLGTNGRFFPECEEYGFLETLYPKYVRALRDLDGPPAPPPPLLEVKRESKEEKKEARRREKKAKKDAKNRHRADPDPPAPAAA